MKISHIRELRRSIGQYLCNFAKILVILLQILLLCSNMIYNDYPVLVYCLCFCVDVICMFFSVCRLIALAFSAAIGITFLVLGCALFQWVTRNNALKMITDTKHVSEPLIYHDALKNIMWTLYEHTMHW